MTGEPKRRPRGVRGRRVLGGLVQADASTATDGSVILTPDAASRAELLAAIMADPNGVVRVRFEVTPGD